jgi:hypothetical protein
MRVAIPGLERWSLEHDGARYTALVVTVGGVETWFAVPPG